METLERLLSVKEMAQKTNLSVSSIYCFINKGIFPAFKIGQSVRLSEKAVIEALEKMKKVASGEAA